MKNLSCGGWEMAQWLEPLDALEEDPGSVSGIRIIKSGSRASSALLPFPLAPGTHTVPVEVGA